tara:strand:+ start:618 stop:1694 length:1077 start_codon:yes stop_codon:yes gene_type:complete
MKGKIKIIFILPSLVPGGAERVISFVAQNIDKKKFEPTLLIAGYKEETAYDVSNVKVKYLNKSRILFSIPSIILFLFKIKPDVVVSSISHTNAAMSIISPLFFKTKFIGREATILSKRKNEDVKKRWSPMSLISNISKNLDMLICQSRDMADDMINNYSVPKNKVCIINNPISYLPPIKGNNLKSDIKKFITVGRLTPVKGHLRILEMLSKINIPFIYTIIGDGDYKNVIFDKVEELSLKEHIVHIPFTSAINDYIAQNDMFLQGSYVEGFPNALLESCVVGTPVLAFNAPGGTKEIVENGVNGFLVDNEQTYIQKMEENINEWDPKLIRESVYKKFNKEKIIKEYESLFLNVINNKI